MGAVLLPLSFMLAAQSLAAGDSAPAPSIAAGAPVARLTQTALTAADVRAAMAGVPEDRLVALREMSSARENLATDLLLRRAIAARAREAGADRDPEIAARLKLAEEKLLAELYLDKTENAAIDDKKLERMAREEYRAFPERNRKEELHARHILVRAQASCQRDPSKIIEELQAKLKAGESFEELARRHSDDSGSAAKGGDLGWVTKGRTVPDFEDALFALKAPGSVSPPVETQFGLHLIQLVERKPPTLPPFDELKASIMENLRNKLRQEMRTKLLESLKPPGTLQIDDAALSAAVGAPPPPTPVPAAGK